MATTNTPPPNHQQRQSIPTTALATTAPQSPVALTRFGMTVEQLELLKRTIAKGTTDDEFALFMTTAQRMGLDPFARQIYAVKRWDSKEKREVMAIQVGIDGFRAVADRSGKDDGQEGPFWCGLDGVWRDVWTGSEPPVAAKVLVYKKGSARPFTGIATYRSYVQTTREGNPNSMWSRGADFMLAKCAEAVALRKAHPSELGGVVAPEEVDVDADEAAVTMRPLPSVAVVSAPPSSAKPAQASPAVAEMTDEEANAIEKLITATQTEAQLKELVRTKIAPRAMSQSTPTRERLLRAHKDHAQLLKEAAQNEQPATTEPAS